MAWGEGKPEGNGGNSCPQASHPPTPLALGRSTSLCRRTSSEWPSSLGGLTAPKPGKGIFREGSAEDDGHETRRRPRRDPDGDGPGERIAQKNEQSIGRQRGQYQRFELVIT